MTIQNNFKFLTIHHPACNKPGVIYRHIKVKQVDAHRFHYPFQLLMPDQLLLSCKHKGRTIGAFLYNIVDSRFIISPYPSLSIFNCS